MPCMIRDSGIPPALWKLDVDAAFRRIPLRPEHLWASKIAFLYKGMPHFSTHFACPFGSSASVHSWERLGAMLANVARRLLKIPALR